MLFNQCSIESFHEAVGLGVVRACLDFLDSKPVTHLLHYSRHKVGALIRQQLRLDVQCCMGYNSRQASVAWCALRQWQQRQIVIAQRLHCSELTPPPLNQGFAELGLSDNKAYHRRPRLSPHKFVVACTILLMYANSCGDLSVNFSANTASMTHMPDSNICNRSTAGWWLWPQRVIRFRDPGFRQKLTDFDKL